jgi:hypothetical protein
VANAKISSRRKNNLITDQSPAAILLLFSRIVTTVTSSPHLVPNGVGIGRGGLARFPYYSNRANYALHNARRNFAVRIPDYDVLEYVCKRKRTGPSSPGPVMGRTI